VIPEEGGHKDGEESKEDGEDDERKVPLPTTVVSPPSPDGTAKKPVEIPDD
jgi:cytokinesis protein